MTARWCWICSAWHVPGETGPHRCRCNPIPDDDLPDHELADQYDREDNQ